MPNHPIDRRVTDAGFDLATHLLGAWSCADAPLRAELEAVIRAHVRRNPAFRRDLERALAFNEDVRQMAVDMGHPGMVQMRLTKLYRKISGESTGT